MIKQVNLITSRPDIELYCKHNLSSSYEIITHNALSEENKRLDGIVIDSSSVFNSEDDVYNFHDLIPRDQLIIILSSETSFPIRLLIEEKFPYVINYPFNINIFNNLWQNIKHNYQANLENNQIIKQSRPVYGFFAGNSKSICKVREGIIRAAQNDEPVLLLGETGTGKNTAAKLIYLMSNNHKAIYIPRAIPTIANGISESELFGAISGAYTDLKEDRNGIFSDANGGTLFFDEIGLATFPFQKMLLYVLEYGVYYRVGNSKKEMVDVRYIFATSEDIEQMIHNGSFSKDLYYRIHDNKIEIPPLRNHMEDLPDLAESYLLKFNKVLSQDALEKLCNYNWPGNVRQLNKTLKKSSLNSRGEFIYAKDIEFVK